MIFFFEEVDTETWRRMMLQTSGEKKSACVCAFERKKESEFGYSVPHFYDDKNESCIAKK